MSLLIKSVQIADSASAHNGKILDVYVDKGIIQDLGKHLDVKAKKEIDGKGKTLMPAWVALLADFCEPGNEHKEDIQSGLAAAAAGGFGTVLLAPNTTPTLSQRNTIDFVQQRAKGQKADLLPLGSISQNIEGKHLAEMMEMCSAQAVAFTDGWKPVQDAGLLIKALEYVKAFDGIIIQIPMMATLADGLMNEGANSVRFGMPGIPHIAETLMVHRDIELARYTQSRIHFSGISTAESLQLIKKAKKEGLQVSCSVTPYHLLFSDKALEHYESIYKVNPPLRSEQDRKAMLKGLEDGSIDAIALHHRPQDWDAKTKEFEYAQNGMASLEVAWPMLLKAAPKVTLERWSQLLHGNIHSIFGTQSTIIEKGANAQLTLVDVHTKWTITDSNKVSKAYNIPLKHEVLTGKAVLI